VKKMELTFLPERHTEFEWTVTIDPAGWVFLGLCILLTLGVVVWTRRRARRRR